jgi:hypothetical protein
MGCGCLQQIRSGSSLGDGVDSINNSREVAKEGEKQADPKLHLNHAYIYVYNHMICSV